jgi:antitoxin component YwqK of YwqJK toxin-antitoxin module
MENLFQNNHWFVNVLIIGGILWFIIDTFFPDIFKKDDSNYKVQKRKDGKYILTNKATGEANIINAKDSLKYGIRIKGIEYDSLKIHKDDSKYKVQKRKDGKYILTNKATREVHVINAKDSLKYGVRIKGVEYDSLKIHKDDSKYKVQKRKDGKYILTNKATREVHVINAKDSLKYGVRIKGVEYDSVKMHKEYHDNGKLYAEGELVNNKMEGVWKYYEAGGQIREYLTFINGEQKGIFKYFDNNGHVICEGIYENEEQKDCVYYDEKGHIKKSTQNHNGFNRSFFDGGGYQEVHKNNGLLNGEMKIYNKYGLLIHHVENIIQDEKNGKIFPDGKETMWYDNGSLKIVSNLKKGLRNGYEICYREEFSGFIDKIHFYENNEDVSLGSFENQKRLLREIYNYMKSGVYFNPHCYITLCKLLGYKGSDDEFLEHADNPKKIIKNLLSLLK